MRQFLPHQIRATRRVELALLAADGTPWRVLMSPGTERFIGAYPRVEGLTAEGPLLCYQSVAAAPC
jgi:hypothetical protein